MTRSEKLILFIVVILMCLGIVGCDTPRIHRYEFCQAQLGKPPNQWLGIFGPLGAVAMSQTDSYQAWSRSMDACLGDFK